MVSALDSGSKGPGSLCYILGQDTLLAQCALDSGSKDPGSSLGRVVVLCS